MHDKYLGDEERELPLAETQLLEATSPPHGRCAARADVEFLFATVSVKPSRTQRELERTAVAIKKGIVVKQIKVNFQLV